MNPILIARVAVVLALILNLKRGLSEPFPPESAHELMAISTALVLGSLEAIALFALGSSRRSATAFIYTLGGIGLLALVTHVPMLTHMIREHDPITFFALVLTEATLLAFAAALKWWHEHRPNPPLPV